ncbi:MAG: BppU family phage baseplate upper protein [Candidatus Pacebacteria bacterium]|nr:BppU family phage baseplate upper protein [Candidatus Paceibacterota bacterium]
MNAYQQTDLLLKIDVKDNEGVPLDLKGCTLFFSLFDRTKEMFEKSLGNGIEIINEATGQIEIDLRSSDLSLPSGDYTAELIVVDADKRRYVALQEQFIIQTSLSKELI